MRAKTATSRRSRSTSAAYHHGDLRQALKNAALVVLEGPDAHALSFRELARTLGVTTSAPYFHFKDRTALLVDIAVDGFNLLHQRMERCVHASALREEVPEVLAVAYLEFAIKERGFYQAMFLPEVSNATDAPELQIAAGRNFQLVCDAIALVRKRFSAQEVSDRATSVWSFLHGMVSLRASGKLGRRISLAKEQDFCREAVRRLLAERIG